MQPHEQAIFFKAVGSFIAAQVKLATAPLIEKINELEEKVKIPFEFTDYQRAWVQSEIETALAKLPKGREITVDEVSAIVKDQIETGRRLGEIADFDDVVSKCGSLIHEKAAEITVSILESVEKMIPEVKEGPPGKDAELDFNFIHRSISDAVAQHFKEFPVENGKDAVVDQEQLDFTVRGAVLAYFEKFPVKDGKDAVVDYDSLRKDIHDFVLEHFAANPVKEGRDGKDADMGVIDATIKSQVTEILSSWPKPKDGEDGRSVGVDELVPVISDLVGKAVSALPVPAHVVDGLIDRDGHLCLTLSNGETKKLGIVVGKDGEDGKPGEPGRPGKDGADGLGFKDMSVIWDGERTLAFKFVLEERTEELSVQLPIVIYRGVWKEGTYAQGDAVSRDGSTWIAIRDTDKQPGTIDSGWVLSAKKGRDGRPGEPGKKGEPGPPGRDGRDLTQMGPDGSKW